MLILMCKYIMVKVEGNLKTKTKENREIRFINVDDVRGNTQYASLA